MSFLFSAYSFECDTGYIDLANEAFSPINDAYVYANAVYDMYTEQFGVKPLNGKIIARYVSLSKMFSKKIP